MVSVLKTCHQAAYTLSISAIVAKQSTRFFISNAILLLLPICIYKLNMHSLIHLLGLDSASGAWYLFWSGLGSDLGELALVGAIMRGVFKLHHQKERHQIQLIDKLTERVSE